VHFNEVSAAHVSTTLHRQQALDVHLHQRQFLAAAESLVALEARLAHLQEQADNALALQAAHQQQQQQPDGYVVVGSIGRCGRGCAAESARGPVRQPN